MSNPGKVEAAARLERLRGFLRSDPSNLNLALDAAALAREVGDLKVEEQLLSAIADHHPDNAEIGHALGINALQQRDYRRAAVCFEALLAIGHDHPALRYNLAFARMYAHEPQAAVDALVGFADADWAQLPQAHKLFAQAAYHVDEDGPARSISHLQRYLAVMADDIDAQGLLALVLFDDDRTDEAERQVQATLLRRPDEPSALLAQGGIALERQEHRLAAESFGTVLQGEPENGRAWSGLAFAHMLGLDMAAAKQAFLKAVQFMPDHIGTWHGLAWLQIMDNDLAGAQQSFDKAMALDRNFGETHGGLAVIAALQGRTEDAQRLAQVGRRLNPQGFSAPYAESLLLVRAGQGEKAGEIVNRLLDSSVVEGGLSTRELTAALLARRRRDAAQEPRQ